jgi:hypothetical protein
MRLMKKTNDAVADDRLRDVELGEISEGEDDE